MIVYKKPESCIKFENKNINVLPINYTFYWINLDKCIQRRENIEKMFTKHNIKNVRIRAILGGPNETDKNLACTKSHKKAIKTFYNTNTDVGIICEDDLTMEYQQYWRKSLTDVIEKAPADWEIIQLSATVDQFWVYATLTQHPYEYIPTYVPSALCYAINRKGAKKILDKKLASHWLSFIYYTDTYIYDSVKTYLYKYPMFTYSDDNNSTIHNEHVPGHIYSKKLITKYLQYEN
jgi:GR25 family glycosyltransferase involved in LPS biosynthesis